MGIDDGSGWALRAGEWPSGNSRNTRRLASLLDMAFGESRLTLVYPYVSVGTYGVYGECTLVRGNN